ncbi:restriction endonuclease subunit R [Pseudoalteromonas sp. NBT06-2]|uniref:DUF3427 domain-containing protein n=1 Tax=Pseudoalteromonas sp. NBT06-2 TaxID=2025950 RepID=UPI000BA6BF5E|nr:DEAD/DEAH box helicase [Pseudoalteromonas sp. NBT06-2]PAJ73339.1 restriction endonuclease subunit R [Pseudoalteromonas sp. NBT06-2]
MDQVGIYEQLITQIVETNLNRELFYVGERQLEPSEASTWLSRFLTRVVEFAIDAVPNSDERLQKQITLANDLVFWLKDHIKDDNFINENLLDNQGKILTALFDKNNPIAADLPKYTEAIFPLTGLTQSELFCGSNAGISLETELKREIKSADKIYWLVSFIKWAGIRIFKKELEEFTRSGKQLKIITTSYMGATDAKAVEFLASLPNTQVKLSYNTQRERLHAKSYLFMRNTQYHTGYIGSSNLSHSALTNGLEWNLKITSQEIPHIINKSLSTFETYWQSNDFELFNGNAESKTKLHNALSEAKGSFSDNNNYYFEVKPFPHQQEILEQLQTERHLHKRYKNLVVAATGTGKTIISAFDFARFYQQNPHANFLFIAHRQEILKQAQSAYRGVLKNSSFGELWVGNHKPTQYKHLFASIQSINNQLNTLPLGNDYFDYIVIDEVHHIAANSYRGLLKRFKAKILLGLTATPERHDGTDILDDFCGVIAAELRLPEAINRRYLSPFQYFGIDDETDLSKITWKQGRYDVSELTHVYTHSDQRVKRILNSLNEIITNVNQMRALAFCVSKEHANYMMKKCLLKGIKCDVLTSDNSKDRDIKQQQLRSKQINILFVVDIFNEGVDIPEVDTLLFLRPTESLTIFLQQLGRGLRLIEGKECCTILDFVGNSRPEYDFSQKFRALVGKTNKSIKEEINNDFPNLPLGCRIELEEHTQEMILSNIRKAMLNKNKLLSLINNFSLQSHLPLTLTNFLHINPNISLEDLYKIKLNKMGGWAVLSQAAKNGQNETINLAEQERFTTLNKSYYRAINHHLLSCSSVSYLQFLQQLCANNFDLKNLKSNTKTTNKIDSNHINNFALMCHYNFWEQAGPKLGFTSIERSLKALSHKALQQELSEVLTLLIDKIHQQELPTKHAIKTHARYTREQILAAFGVSSFDKKSPAREGVLELKAHKTELLFVTLNKCEKQFSPTTMYHDYAISESLFHWQSQNSARPEHGKGLSYIEHIKNKKQIILFVREQAKDENGRTMGFMNFGPVNYVKHQGQQPMNITWKLEHPMPASLWHETAKLAVG